MKRVTEMNEMPADRFRPDKAGRNELTSARLILVPVAWELQYASVQLDTLYRPE